jgi:hypothetical protein
MDCRTTIYLQAYDHVVTQKLENKALHLALPNALNGIPMVHCMTKISRCSVSRRRLPPRSDLRRRRDSCPLRGGLRSVVERSSLWMSLEHCSARVPYPLAGDMAERPSPRCTLFTVIAPCYDPFTTSLPAEIAHR